MNDAATNQVDRAGCGADWEQPERCWSDLPRAAFEPQR